MQEQKKNKNRNIWKALFFVLLTIFLIYLAFSVAIEGVHYNLIYRYQNISDLCLDGWNKTLDNYLECGVNLYNCQNNESITKEDLLTAMGVK